MDNIGKKYGLITIKDRKREEGRTYYLCDCECGNNRWIRSDVIKSGQKSCGCLSKTTQFKSEDGTNIRLINRNKPTSSNKSGVAGVSWDKERNKWKAEIIFKGKKHYLGRFEDKQDAINARKEAEEELHKKYIKEQNLLYNMF